MKRTQQRKRKRTIHPEGIEEHHKKKEVNGLAITGRDILYVSALSNKVMRLLR